MLIAVNLAFLAATVLFGVIPIALTWRFKKRLPELKVPEQPTAQPYAPAAVILPCKGLDPGFEDNVRAFLEQDHPDFELLFAVATEDDPAHDALGQILASARARGSSVKSSLTVAGIHSGRAQKLTNQLAALSQMSARTEVIVFVDSDSRPDRGFIRRLVTPLPEPTVGATTGYRWYHPTDTQLGSVLRSTWNAGALPLLVDVKRNFAWGGAMAIRREIFERADIASAWANAVSDDFPFTVQVRRLGLELRFVPSCVAISYEASTLAETVEFTNRQSLISRVYFPPLWWSAALGHSLANIFLLYGAGSLAAWLVTSESSYVLGAACLVLLPLQLVNAAWLFESVRDLLPTLGARLSALRWAYILTAPVASLLSLTNTIWSLTTRRITWRGITYELRSPTETVVISNAASEG